jgi:WD40 repeat protein
MLCAIAPLTGNGTVPDASPSEGPTTVGSPVPTRAVRFDPSCQRLAAAFADGTVRLWNLKLSRGTAATAPGPPIAGRPGTTGYGVDFSPDGKLLASGSSDRTLTLWSTEDGRNVVTIETKNGSARSAAFTPDGKHVAVPGFWRTRIFDTETGRTAQPENLPALGHGGGYTAAFTSDGKLLIATGPDGTVRLWDLLADPTTVLRSTASPVRDLAVASVGERCVIASVQTDGQVRVRGRTLDGSGNHDGSAAIWREMLRANAGTPAQTVAISSDASWIVVGRGDGHIITLSVADGRIIQDLPAHHEGVNVVRLTKDARTLLSGGSDHLTKIFRRRADVAGWEMAAEFECGGDVIGAAVHPDGRSAATTARPGNLQFWDIPKARSLGAMTLSDMPWRLAYSPDGRRIAAGSWDRSVQVWDVTDAAPAPARLTMTLLGHSQLVMNEAFNQTGDLLASVSHDGSLKVWDVSEVGSDDTAPRQLDHRRCLVTLDADAGDSLSVAFLPSRRASAGESASATSIAVGYYDGTVRVWDLGYFDRHLTGQIDYQRSLRQRR